MIPDNVMAVCVDATRSLMLDTYGVNDARDEGMPDDVWQEALETCDSDATTFVAAAFAAAASEGWVMVERGAVREVVAQLDAEHRPDWYDDASKAADKEPLGCVTCYPSDSSWPCTTRLITDELRALIADQTEGERT